MFCKKGVLKNFAHFTGKHLCWSLFLTRLQAFINKRLNTGVSLRNLQFKSFEEHLLTATSE